MPAIHGKRLLNGKRFAVERCRHQRDVRGIPRTVRLARNRLPSTPSWKRANLSALSAASPSPIAICEPNEPVGAFTFGAGQWTLRPLNGRCPEPARDHAAPLAAVVMAHDRVRRLHRRSAARQNSRTVRATASGSSRCGTWPESSKTRRVAPAISLAHA